MQVLKFKRTKLVKYNVTLALIVTRIMSGLSLWLLKQMFEICALLIAVNNVSAKAWLCQVGQFDEYTSSEFY